MSVPLPAMFVDIVIAPSLPASAIIAASDSSFFAFSTLHRAPSFIKAFESAMDSSILRVPTSIGLPVLCSFFISRIKASSLAAFVL